MESVGCEGALPQGLREIEVGGGDARAGVGRDRMCGNCCMMGWNLKIGGGPKAISWIEHERVSEEGGQLPVEVGGNVPHLLGQGPVVGVEGRGKV